MCRFAEERGADRRRTSGSVRVHGSFTVGDRPVGALDDVREDPTNEHQGSQR